MTTKDMAEMIMTTHRIDMEIRRKRKIKNAIMILGMPVGYVAGYLGSIVIKSYFTGYLALGIELIYVAIIMFGVIGYLYFSSVACQKILGLR